MEESLKLLKSGITMSSAKQATFIPEVWNAKIYLSMDTSTAEGSALKELLHKLEVNFDSFEAE